MEYDHLYVGGAFDAVPVVASHDLGIVMLECQEHMGNPAVVVWECHLIDDTFLRWHTAHSDPDGRKWYIEVVTVLPALEEQS